MIEKADKQSTLERVAALQPNRRRARNNETLGRNKRGKRTLTIFQKCMIKGLEIAFEPRRRCTSRVSITEFDDRRTTDQADYGARDRMRSPIPVFLLSGLTFGCLVAVGRRVELGTPQAEGAIETRGEQLPPDRHKFSCKLGRLV